MNSLTKIAALLVFISALFHLAAPILSGFASESMPLLIFAVLYLALGWWVFKNKRWAMWLSFFAMLFGGIAGMAGYMDAGIASGWTIPGIWIASWAAAVCLFLVLWRDHVPTVVIATGRQQE